MLSRRQRSPLPPPLRPVPSTMPPLSLESDTPTPPLPSTPPHPVTSTTSASTTASFNPPKSKPCARQTSPNLQTLRCWQSAVSPSYPHDVIGAVCDRPFEFTLQRFNASTYHAHFFPNCFSYSSANGFRAGPTASSFTIIGSTLAHHRSYIRSSSVTISTFCDATSFISPGSAFTSNSCQRFSFALFSHTRCHRVFRTEHRAYFDCSALPLAQRPTCVKSTRSGQSALGLCNSGTRLRPSTCAFKSPDSVAPAISASVGKKSMCAVNTSQSP